MLLTLAVPFAAYLGVSSWREAVLERENEGQRMLGVARVTAARLDDHVGDIRQMLTVLSEIVGVTPADSGRNDALLLGLKDKLPPQINNLTVWTLSGANVGTQLPILREHGYNISDRKVFKEALRSRDLVVEAPVVAPSNGERVGLFALAIVRDGKVEGVVLASTRLTPLQTLLTPANTLPPGAVVTVTDSSGIVLARSIDPGRWIGRNLLTTGGGNLASSLVEREGVRDAKSADGIRRIAGFTTARRVPWLVYVGVPTEVALAKVEARLREHIAVGAVLLLVGLGAAAWMGGQISSPLHQLGADATLLEQGELSHRSAVRQGGEIGLLAATLNRMADALQERNAALQASQEQLQQVTDNLPVMISYLDTEQRFRFANRVYEEWLHMPPHTLIGLSVEEVYGRAAYEGFRHQIENALAGQRVVYERRLQTPDGSRQVEVTLIPHRRDGGEVQGLFTLAQDVTAARHAEAARILSEERLSLALEGSGLALFDWDISRGLVYHSPQAAVMRGAAAEEITSSPEALQAMVHPDDRGHMIESLKAAVIGKADRYDAEFRVPTTAGGWIWLRGRGRVVERDSNGRALRLAGTYTDITERRADEVRLRQLAEFDSLTGLPNRALFNDRLAQAMGRASRSDKPMALLFLDIDHFKAVNDTHGHEAGDDVLKAFARALESSVRASDTVARLAGDEFTIVLEGLAQAEDARKIAETLLAKVRTACARTSPGFAVTTSIGIAIFTEGDTQATMLRRADAGLYEAKRAGRDCCAFGSDVVASESEM